MKKVSIKRLDGVAIFEISYRFFFQNSFSKLKKKIEIFFFWIFLLKILRNCLEKKIYMISWKTKHFPLLTFFENLNFWNNDILFYLFFDLNHHLPKKCWDKKCFELSSLPSKSKNSILVGSVLVHPAKDLLLKHF